jgi:hypothetical protein
VWKYPIDGAEAVPILTPGPERGNRDQNWSQTAKNDFSGSKTNHQAVSVSKASVVIGGAMHSAV